jgi:hypothetical protein
MMVAAFCALMASVIYEQLSEKGAYIKSLHTNRTERLITTDRHGVLNHQCHDGYERKQQHLQELKSLAFTSRRADVETFYFFPKKITKNE